MFLTLALTTVLLGAADAGADAPLPMIETTADSQGIIQTTQPAEGSNQGLIETRPMINLTPQSDPAPVAAPASAPKQTAVVAAPSEPARAPEAASGVTLANTRTSTHKSVSMLLVFGELLVGTVVTYGFTVIGIAANFGLGGAQIPPDGNDLLMLGVLPLVGAAASTWLVGLLDLSQRSFIGSMLSAVVGALIGEIGGVAAGYAIGQKVAPNDMNGAVSVAVLVAPVFSVVGSIIFMEIFKPGEKTDVTATVVPQRMSDGRWAFAPGVGVRF